MVAFIVGLVAVTLYLLGYQQKKRKQIIIFNVTSRVLYILQYVLLSAYEGAVLDIAGTISSLFAQKKNVPFIKKHLWVFIVGVNIIIIIMGALVYKNPLSILPVIAVILHTGAFWLDNEKHIRLVSLAGSPLWLIYNFACGAYGSCIGDVLSIVSIVTAMIRYDYKK